MPHTHPASPPPPHPLPQLSRTPPRLPPLSRAPQVLALLRMELFRTLMMQKVEFFDRHSASELQALLSVELDTIRSFVFT